MILTPHILAAVMALATLRPHYELTNRMISLEVAESIASHRNHPDRLREAIQEIERRWNVKLSVEEIMTRPLPRSGPVATDSMKGRRRRDK